MNSAKGSPSFAAYPVDIYKFALFYVRAGTRLGLHRHRSPQPGHASAQEVRSCQEGRLFEYIHATTGLTASGDARDSAAVPGRLSAPRVNLSPANLTPDVLASCTIRLVVFITRFLRWVLHFRFQASLEMRFYRD